MLLRYPSSLDVSFLRSAKILTRLFRDERSVPEPFVAALAEVRSFAGAGTLGFLNVNRLCPGDSVPLHVDPLADGKRHSRWYLPLLANQDCLVFTRREGWQFLEVGSWYGPIRYWETHGMKNDGKTLRDYLSVDLVVDPEVDGGS